MFHFDLIILLGYKISEMKIKQISLKCAFREPHIFKYLFLLYNSFHLLKTNLPTYTSALTYTEGFSENF